MVHGTKTFEILGIALFHHEAPAEIVEGFRDRRASTRPPKFVTAPVLQAPQAVVEYGQPAHRCGVRGARTRGHVRTVVLVIVYVTLAFRVASTASVDHNDSGAKSFPFCGSAGRHRHVIADDVRSASHHVRSGPFVVKF